jgi:hypothetical protein
LNEGANYQEAVDLVQELDPKLTQEQARHPLSRNLLKGDSSIVKSKAGAPQQTTTKRSNITVPQQYRWHQTYEYSLDELRRNNTSVCRISCKTFGELIHCFITAGDDANLMTSDDNRGVKVIGATNRKKDKKKSADCRSSISLYRTGAVAGDTGPKIFLMKGKTKRHGFTEHYLRSNGCAIGSTVIMTENLFMIVDAWERMTPNIILGLRNIDKYVVANPQWWVLEIFDGFGAHLLSYKGNEERFAANIFSLKEEVDTSHVCQAYDKHVAKDDTAAKSLSLSFLRTGFKVSNLLIDQWSLVRVGMFVVRDTTCECWTQSFDSCNLDPCTGVSFGEWCERIGHFLQGGESFVLETFNTNSEAYHVYAMLPTWWHAMTPHEKKGVAEVAEAHDRQFTVAEMHLACSIPMKDLQKLRLCLECLWENPAQLDMEKPIALDNQSAISAEVTEVKGLVKDASSGLEWFQLKPPGMKGQKLVDDMFSQQQLSFKTKEAHLYMPSSYLDIAIKPSRIEVLKYMTAPDLSKRAIMKD